MKLTHFRDLLAVVNAGSLRGASRRLGIEQPVITRSIRTLENELGQALFERHSKGVTLTPVGERFVRRVESIQAEIRRATDEVAQWNGENVGEVSVGMSPYVSMTLLPTTIAAFNRRHPEAVVKMQQTLFAPVEQLLTDGLMDFWVGAIDGKAYARKFTIRELMKHNRRIFARSDHPLSTARSLEDLVNARWTRPALEDRYAARDLEMISRERGLPTPIVSVEVSSMLIMLLTVANTNLLTVLPEKMPDLMPMSRFCRPLANIPPIPSDPICIVYRRGLPLTPLAQTMCDFFERAALNFKPPERVS